MMLENCTLSVLTWRTPQTLANTLATLAPIRDAFADRYVICQEQDPRELEVAQKHGFSPRPLRENIGIQEGLAACAEAAKTDLVLVMENDCALVNTDVAMKTLAECRDAFARNDVDVIKLSVATGPPSRRFVEYWGDAMPPRKTWRAILRPGEARACSGQIVYHPAFPADGSADVHRVSPHIYVTRSRYLGWTNRAFMIRREFFLNTIIAFARAHPAIDKVNGKPDLEKEIGCFWNRHWWRGQNFKVGIALPGLFGHVRLERNDDDEKSDV